MKSPKKAQIFSRRKLITTGITVGLLASPARSFAALPKPEERSLSFYNLHTGESFDRPYRADGSYIPSALQEINKVLRDFRTGEVYEIDPSLLDFLEKLRREMDSKEAFHVISGYRSPKTNAMLSKAGGGVAKKSFHMKGMAIDVRLPNRDLVKLRDMARSMKLGGVGFYPKSGFVHLDTGRVRSW